MPSLQQQQQNRRAQLHAIREEQNWLRTMQRTHLGLAMTRYARELILERRNRNYRREIQQDQTPRLNITLASRSLILTITEPHLQKVLAHLCPNDLRLLYDLQGKSERDSILVPGQSLFAMGLQFVEDVACGYGGYEIQIDDDGLYECGRIGSLDFGDVAECKDILSDTEDDPDAIISS
ncbi:hypothetical protein BGAL_0482g00090 [Botrytis galanthina]|uniref:Uncharacterized protein n=1 Tax=Botrytis galanthina TaxID=278940 RepID=A0A4S8QXI1_9HELO|nr:hypothetical protein BGAL_0482g00090 [Botrytis galanthina]